jgi:hypothetical protein
MMLRVWVSEIGKSARPRVTPAPHYIQLAPTRNPGEPQEPQEAGSPTQRNRIPRRGPLGSPSPGLIAAVLSLCRVL